MRLTAYVYECILVYNACILDQKNRYWARIEKFSAPKYYAATLVRYISIIMRSYTVARKLLLGCYFKSFEGEAEGLDIEFLILSV